MRTVATSCSPSPGAGGRSKPHAALAGALAALALVTQAWAADPSPAHPRCPNYGPLGRNFALNPDFEVPETSPLPIGGARCTSVGTASAAAHWALHTDNVGSQVCSYLVPSTAPGGGGSSLRLLAYGKEGGVLQPVQVDPAKSWMFSVWVFVRRGQVGIQSRGMTGGPEAWSTKVGEWEQLRVCNNARVSVDTLVIANQADGGGEFLIDRAELRENAPQTE